MKKKWPVWLEAIEHAVDFILPFLLVPLTLMIVLEFTPLGDTFHSELVIADTIIILVFAVDLSFKYARSRNTATFVRLYWIDILAVLPFHALFQLFNFFQGFFLVGEQTNRILHEAVLIREARLLTEAEAAARVTRSVRITRTVSRFLRFLRIRWYSTTLHLGKSSLSARTRKKDRFVLKNLFTGV